MESEKLVAASQNGRQERKESQRHKSNPGKKLPRDAYFQ